jgi:hypothetical protein
MKNTSKNIGVQTSKESIDYFEYARQNPEKGKVISHAEAMRKIMDAKAQKLRKAS